MDKPVLYIFSGLPASGKSTLGKLLAKRTGAIYIRIDTVEQALNDLCHFDAESEGYQLSYRVVQDNLTLGVSAIADCCNPIKITRDEWEQIALDCGASFINIEISCSDRTEHRARLDNRNRQTQNTPPVQWEDIEDRGYEAWDKRIVNVDTSGQTISESFTELCERLELSSGRYV